MGHYPAPREVETIPRCTTYCPGEISASPLPPGSTQPGVAPASEPWPHTSWLLSPFFVRILRVSTGTSPGSPLASWLKRRVVCLQQGIRHLARLMHLSLSGTGVSSPPMWPPLSAWSLLAEAPALDAGPCIPGLNEQRVPLGGPGDPPVVRSAPWVDSLGCSSPSRGAHRGEGGVGLTTCLPSVSPVSE